MNNFNQSTVDNISWANQIKYAGYNSANDDSMIFYNNSNF